MYSSRNIKFVIWTQTQATIMTPQKFTSAVQTIPANFDTAADIFSPCSLDLAHMPKVVQR